MEIFTFIICPECFDNPKNPYKIVGVLLKGETLAPRNL